jgi:plastocyanin
MVTGLACHSSTEPSLPAADVAIVLNASTMGSTAFSPNPFSESFATRAKVIWVNADRTSSGYGGTTGTTHHLISDTGVFDSGAFAPGTSFAYTFPASGTYAYHCTIHPSMVGTITLAP